MNLPFSKWVALENRNNISAIERNDGGVYLIGRRVKRGVPPIGLSNRIIYIGRAKNLRDRLDAFDKACECFYGIHAGGNTLHKREINPNFGDTIRWYKARDYSRKEREAQYKEYLLRHPDIGERWQNIRNTLSVSVWTPGNGGLDKFSELPEKHQLALVEVTVQANYYLDNKRLPICNKRIG